MQGGDTFDTYHNESWQVLEVRKNTDTDPIEQWVWDQGYVDAPMAGLYDFRYRIVTLSWDLHRSTEVM